MVSFHFLKEIDVVFESEDDFTLESVDDEEEWICGVGDGGEHPVEENVKLVSSPGDDAPPLSKKFFLAC